LLSPETAQPRGRAFLALVSKEWRDILAGQTIWVLLLLLSALIGYSYTQAVALYGEASKSAQQLPEVARSLSPLDGVFVPTFGALYLANTFLFPFIAIRSIASEKQTCTLKLLLQLPCSLSAVVTAKVLMLLTVWLISMLPCLTAVALWSLSGGHVGWAEVTNLFLGHLLYAAIVVGISFVAAAVAESSATAAILTLAATLASWVLDFAAAGEGGLLKSLSNLSLTTLLRGFEQGVFSSIATFGALIASALLISIAGIWLDLRTTLARKLLTSALAAVFAGGLAAGVAIRPLNVDTTEDGRNSFPPADTATLARLDKPLHVLVRLAPEDPRYIDFERKVLSKLRRSVRDFSVTLQSDTRSGLFENSDNYGVMVYGYDGKQAESRSTGEGEVLPLIYGLAGIERKAVPDRDAYPGYPLQTRTDLAQVWFYLLLPLLIVAAWALAHRQATVWPPRTSQAIRSRIRTRRPFHGGM
jgi:ABC-type transport system involved in multi-copper enzyme maturation permease subunit